MKHDGLHWRERQVLMHAADGLYDAEIAKALDLSEDTVKQYLKRVYRKLGARNRTQAVVLAIRSGEIALEQHG